MGTSLPTGFFAEHLPICPSLFHACPVLPSVLLPLLLSQPWKSKARFSSQTHNPNVCLKFTAHYIEHLDGNTAIQVTLIVSIMQTPLLLPTSSVNWPSQFEFETGLGLQAEVRGAKHGIVH